MINIRCDVPESRGKKSDFLCRNAAYQKKGPLLSERPFSSDIVVGDGGLFGIAVLILVFAGDGGLTFALFHPGLFVIRLAVLWHHTHLGDSMPANRRTTMEKSAPEGTLFHVSD